MADTSLIQFEENITNQTLTIHDFPPDTFRDIDKDKIVITKDDLKVMPSLTNFISIKHMLESDKVKLADYDINTQNEIINIFLKEYGFIQLILNDLYFNYTKLEKLWPQEVYLQQMFHSKKATVYEVQTIGEDGEYTTEEYKFFKIKDLNYYELNYVGILFFVGYSKTEKEVEFVIQEFEAFTDTRFDFNDFSMYKNLKDFFINQFIVFLNINNGGVFGCYEFGSNVKQLVQSKKLTTYYNKLASDIEGFVTDISLLYGGFIKLEGISFNDYDYEIQIQIRIKFEKETLQFNLKLNTE